MAIEHDRLRLVDPRTAGETDIVGFGGRLTVERLIWAYGHGVFPWPHRGYPMLWFCPRERAILDFSELHVPRRLARSLRRSTLTCTIDRAFGDVIAACRDAARPDQDGTWITPEIVRVYTDLHVAGYAHSVEAWENGLLVGGLYGVSVDGAFSGESMFHRVDNASKLALLHLVDHAGARGLDWIDIQTLTPHMEALGARTVPRDAYLDRLAETRRLGLSPFG
ncbi:MAG: leucyl/phenylalanyl-tRNA--protein transferase [Capsulimonadaceae bacterium]